MPVVRFLLEHKADVEARVIQVLETVYLGGARSPPTGDLHPAQVAIHCPICSYAHLVLHSRVF